jgi:hypothetical protein
VAVKEDVCIVLVVMELVVAVWKNVLGELIVRGFADDKIPD